MSSWFETGRPALLQAVHDACLKIDADLREELSRQHRGEAASLQHAILDDNDSLRQQRDAETIERLTAENAALREQLAAMKSDQGTSLLEILRQPQSRQPTPLYAPAQTPSNPGRNWKAAFLGALEKNHALSQQIKESKEAWDKKKLQFKAASERNAFLMRSIRVAEQSHKIQILDPDHQGLRRSNLDEGHLSDENATNLSFPSDNERAIVEETELPLLPLSVEDNLTTEETDRQASSTQGDTDEGSDRILPSLSQGSQPGRVLVKTEPLSDPPIVVSERSVRKRKADEETEPGTARRVKMEDTDGSSPTFKSSHCNVFVDESLDLGEVSHLVQTPRKHRLEDPRSERLDPRASMITPMLSAARREMPPPQTLPAPRTSGVLQPLSANRLINGARDAYKERQLRNLKPGLARGIEFLAEDGGRYTTENTPDLSEASAIKGRLDALLDSPSVDEQSPLQRLKRNRVPEPSRTRALHIPQRRDLPFDKTLDKENRQQQGKPEKSRKLPEQHLETPGGGRKGGNPLKQNTASSLRSRRVSDLRLDDFKVNPLTNDGHDFAFSEVVRRKEDKSALTGCTDMDCCGKKFRAFALSQKPDSPMTESERIEERTLLEQYLGDDAYRLTTMDKEERDELWLVAKTQQLADQHGTHRVRFSRMKSPPGFWNADFPSTQELKEDKAEASRREAAAIQSRHREAMRPGGRWLFRDE